MARSLSAPSLSPITRRLAASRTAASAAAPHARLGAGIALTGLVLAGVGAITHSSLVIGPFAATAALKHSAPTAPVVQPRNVIGGYLIGTLIGLVAGAALGPTALATVGAAALAAVVLLALRLEHPPAIAMTVIAAQAPTPHVVQIAMLGTLTMALTTAVLAPALHRERWPRRIAAAADC